MNHPTTTTRPASTRRIHRLLVLTAGFLWISAALPATAALRVPAIFGSHMVLQRDKPVRVWGWASAWATVTVSFAGQNKTATAAGDGSWTATIDPLAVSTTGRTLTATSTLDPETVTFGDVLVGEVWLGSGQSNMELQLAGTDGSADAIYQANHPLIRLMTVPAETSGTPADDIPGATWQICTPSTVGAFSAVGYYFARDVQAATGVPVGMVVAARGGTYPESWQTRASLESLNSAVVNELLANYDQQAAAWVAGGQTGTNPYTGIKGLEWPAGCYNFMIHPIEKLTLRGALFYQGENSAVTGGNRTRGYPTTYPAVVRNWRTLFNDPELPFCVIEMAPWGGPAVALTSTANIDNTSPFVRDVHLQTHINWPATGLVVTMDVGKVGDMHPLNKEPVGQRAAGWVLSQVYQTDDRTWSGPLYRAMTTNGNKAVIHFHRPGLALPLSTQNPAGTLNGFIIAGADRVWYDAQAAIVGETIEVWSASVPVPAAVRYAWEDCQGQVNLIVNAAGLPASPFRTDHWVTNTLFDQPLLLPADGVRPWADAGPDRLVLSPANATALDGSGSYDPDGTISSYAWTQVSGPSATMSGAASNTLSLSAMALGTYRFRLTVTDNSGHASSDDVQVLVTANPPPVAEAGGDRTLIYKFLGTVLDGTASYDSGGSISAYAWSQVSGPNTATLANANTATATATGLVTGTYVFRLTVTDNQGAQASDDVTVVALDNPIINGGFETGDLTGWTTAGDPAPVLESTNTHSGNYAVFIGNDSGQGGTGWYNLYLGTPNLLANLPANATLSFWVYRRSAGGIMNVRVREGIGAGSTDLVNPWPVPRASYNDTGWVHYTVDLSALAGKTITVYVELYQSDKHTYMLMDDVELLVLPKADFTATPTQGVVPLTVGFTDTSFAGDGPITNRHWDFGDGTTLDTTATSVTHTYTTAGTRSVALTITNSSGRTDTLTRTSLIQAVGANPVAGFTATPASGLAPLPVTFSDSSTPGPGTITNRHWDFGDGTTLDTSATSVSHTYGSPGNYVVTLTVTDSTGPSGSTSRTVVANPVDFTNGNFETGDFTGWTATTGVAITTANTHSGTSAAMVGRTTATTSGTIYNLISNAVTLPANATLSFWVYRKNNGGDVLNLRVRGGSPVADLVDPWPIPRASYNDTGWVHYTVDLSAHAGKSVYIYIEVFVSANKWNYMLLDDVSLLQPATYDSWAFARGLPAMSAGGDFDGDGISNLVEYALGLTPTVPNKPPGTLTGSVLSFSKGADAVANGDVSYAIEESDDLGATDPWSAVTSYTTNNSTTISYTMPSGKTKNFARLRVVKSTP